MKQVYRVFAFLVAAAVMFQAASIAFAMFSFFHWIEGGGSIDQSTELGPAIGGHFGFVAHALAGIIVVPALALLFLISSFFAKVPGGVKWALIVFGLTVLQVALGIFAREALSGLGWLHGINAALVFAAAVMAGIRAKRATAEQKTEAEAELSAASVA